MDTYTTNATTGACRPHQPPWLNARAFADQGASGITKSRMRDYFVEVRNGEKVESLVEVLE